MAKNKNEKIITGLKRISKPGLRVYAGKEELQKVLGGLGIAILSTNKGVITDKEARKTSGRRRGSCICMVSFGSVHSRSRRNTENREVAKTSPII